MAAVTDRAAARTDATALAEQLAAGDLDVGIGLARRDSAYVVKVDLADAAAAGRVPGAVDGVRVVTEVVGTVRAR